MTTTESVSIGRAHTPARESPEAGGSATLRGRIQAEYVEMPGLTQTLSQSMRLWGLTVAQSERLLAELVDAGFLVRDGRGAYRRLGCPRCS